MTQRGQSSIEVITYTGLFMLAVSAALVYFHSDWETNNRFATAETTVRDIKVTADKVYAAGPGRRETITIRVPSDVVRTQASDNRLLMQLRVPNSGASDALEITGAPVKGYIPSKEGVHRLTVEYVHSGFVIIGGGLTIEPPNVELETTLNNVTNYTATISNLADREITGIQIRFQGDTEGWFTINESLAFSLKSGEGKPLLVEVTTPASIMPASYLNYLVAESSDAYAEETVNVKIGGVVCGDTVKDALEECDTRTPFTFPDRNNPNCPNPPGGVQCDAGSQRYRALDQYGDCLDDCTCRQDTSEWTVCGAGCTDPNYCNNCGHCFDLEQNCYETAADAGGNCPICDGVDDVLEGSPCNLGETRDCGIGDCAGGTKECMSSGAYCRWSNCTTYGIKCPSKKCCSCIGDAINPTPTYNGTQNLDCTPAYDEMTCGRPSTCGGGYYRGECVGLDVCLPDWDGGTWPITENISACIGVECGSPEGTCYDNLYPCHGRRTTYACSVDGRCLSSTSEDGSPCENMCPPPPTIILHKLDVNSYDDYVDAPASCSITSALYPLWGNDGRCFRTCPTEGQMQETYSDVYYSDAGAYYPYGNGRLHIFGKAGMLDYYCMRNNHNWVFCMQDCSWTPSCGGNHIRIGNDQDNYWEYAGLTPDWNDDGWQRQTIDLRHPQRIVGSPDWNGSIGFLQLSHITYNSCNRDMGSCQLWEDIITLER